MSLCWRGQPLVCLLNTNGYAFLRYTAPHIHTSPYPNLLSFLLFNSMKRIGNTCFDKRITPTSSFRITRIIKNPQKIIKWVLHCEKKNMVMCVLFDFVKMMIQYLFFQVCYPSNAFRRLLEAPHNMKRLSSQMRCFLRERSIHTSY